MSLTLEQAADFLKLHPSTVQERAKAGIIPASKPGRRWVFLQHELEAYRQALLKDPDITRLLAVEPGQA
jgi:excisionase family DNA binding protein